MDSYSGIILEETRSSEQLTDFTPIPCKGFNILCKAKRYGRWWMLKGLKPVFRNQETYKALLHKEFDILISLQHPNIVTASSIEEVAELGTCIVMECIDGITNEGDEVSENTIYSYLKALRKIFVVEDSAAWNPNLRSKSAIRTSGTRYFTDPSIATAALGLGPEDLINDLNTFGLFFETLCVRDLRVYADALGGSVYHFRDKNGLECDAVIHLRNGKFGLVEVKLGGDKLIEDGAKTLNLLESKIDTTKMKAPSFKMILTGVGQYAYQRPQDGVYVVPIGCLKD